MEAGELVDHDQHIEGRAGELVDQGQHIEVAGRILGPLVSSLTRASVGREPVTAEDCGSDCGSGVELGANTYRVLVLPTPPPIRSWESLVDVVAGSHPVRGYCCAWCILSGINSNELPTIVSLTKCKLSGTDLLRRSGTFSRLSQKSVLSPR